MKLTKLFVLAGCVCASIWKPAAEPVNFAEADAAAKKFTLPTNFVIRTWAAEPQLANPVSFTFDQGGRAFIAETYRLNNSVFDITQNTNWLGADLALETVEERVKFMAETFGANVGALTKYSERLQMVADTNGDGAADLAKTVAEDFRAIESGIAAGVLANGTNLWFASIPDLWRFYDSDEDGIPEKPFKMHSGFGVHIGVTGHDLHGLAMGPDGRLYFSVGDRGFNVSADGKQFKFPHMGGVLRCEPDGSNLEVFATGMRNPQELAFDHHGNLFTGDNDTAGADDCRLLYVVEGGDYGWRTPYQHLKDFGPWVQENLWRGGKDGLLPHSGNPAQGPSGLAFYPGSGLADNFKEHFFMCDFPGGIWTFKVVPEGAGFSLTNKSKFIWNCWPTDVEFGPEAGIFFSDWVGGWGLPQKGRIYHLIPEGTQVDAALKTALKETFTDKTAPELTTFLASSDYRIRQKPQFELARRSDATALMKVALNGKGYAPLHSLWGLGQIARKNKTAVPWSELQPLARAADKEIRAQIAHLAAEGSFTEAADELKHMLNDPEPRVKFFAAESLAKLKITNALPELLRIARQSGNDPFILHPVVMAWSSMAKREDLAKLSKDSSVLARKVALYALRRTLDSNVALFLEDRVLSEEAARAIYDQPITNSFSSLASLISKNDLAPATQLLAVHANYRIGDAASAKRLGAFVRMESKPVALRASALALLGSWSKPDPIDRVVGFHRPLPERDPAPARAEVEELFTGLRTNAPSELLEAVLHAAKALEAPLPVENLLEIFRNAQINSSARIAALDSLAGRDIQKAEPALLEALSSKEEKMRSLAASLAAKTRSEPVVAALGKLAENDTSIGVRQKALQALKGAATAEADQLVQRLASQLKDGTIPPSLRLEVLDLVNTSPRAEWKPDEETGKKWSRAALLAGGSAEEGGRIFKERADVSCARCHAVRGNGGTVGPDLTQVAQGRTREYLLDAIQLPNKDIAKGYEQAIVQRKSGEPVAGLVTMETDQFIQINSPEEGIVKISKAEIESRKNALSAMPEGLAEMLTPYQLRNLVEYLATLK